jgi:ABC-type transport system involved in multi-copper enzyme maturation permease subunit
VSAVAPYRSPRPSGRDGFLQLLHAEWTKFRTVRGWVVGTAVGALMIVAMAALTGGLSHSQVCIGRNGAPPTCHAAHPRILTGPNGAPVTDQYELVHQPLHGNGSITVRVTSLTGRYLKNNVAPVGANPFASTIRGVQPWSKAGVIITAGTNPASPYAAAMVTGTHGVRMQYDYTHDVAGTPGTVSAASVRWLRLTRVGDTITGYDSTDGSHWTTIATAHLAALPDTVQVGMFATSPDYLASSSSGNGGPSYATGVFDRVDLRGAAPGGGWRGSPVGNIGLAGPGSYGGGFHETGGAFTVVGSGDIAPAVVGSGTDPGQGLERTLIGAFIGLIVLAVVASLFIAGEYRRGLIRSTFAASPRRGRVLAAKAIVIGGVTFVTCLIAAGIAVPVGEHVLRGNGVAVYPAGTATELRAIIGTAALLAVAAVLALALATILRRSALAVTAVIVLIVLPYILAVASSLPAGPAEWLLRVTPAAAFAVQQTLIRYPQVVAPYTPSDGYFPLSPWAGFAVLCGYTLCALGLATYLLRRRDV